MIQSEAVASTQISLEFSKPRRIFHPFCYIINTLISHDYDIITKEHYHYYFIEKTSKNEIIIVEKTLKTKLKLKIHLRYKHLYTSYFYYEPLKKEPFFWLQLSQSTTFYIKYAEQNIYFREYL